MTYDVDILVERALVGRRPRQQGRETYFLCPAHPDTNPTGCSWNRAKRVWSCLVCGAGGSTEDLARRLGIEIESAQQRAERATTVAAYDYHDEAGRLLYQKVRFQPKRFQFRRPDGNGGWLWGRGSGPWVLYRLPELIASSGRVYITEGEKDADNVTALGLIATTCAEGAQARPASRPDHPAPQKWKPEYNPYFAGRDVVILPDNDQAGRDFADYIAHELQPLAASVRVLRLPGLADKQDVTDWIFQSGGTRDDLERLADECPLWEPPGTPPTMAVFPLSDAGNAELFASIWGDRVRFDHRLGRWLLWDRHRWRPDSDGEIIRLAIAAARERARAAADLEPDLARATFSHAKRSENSGPIEAMLRIARAIPPIADNGDGWDANPLQLGCENGVVNLTTGALEPGRREDRITRSTGIVYDPTAECPRWKQFLREIFEDDEEVIAFIQRAVGYSLTGVVTEQVWFLLHGSGANGKSTFVDVIASTAGDYAADTPAETITGRGLLSSGAATPDIAALIGRRIVTCSETEDTARLNAARMKQLSGGSPITARPLYREPITFHPQLHLWLTTNHLPAVDDDSEGFWRRVRLVRFNRRFEGPERDPALEGKLRAELPGILRWAVEGAVAWHREGLQPPRSVMLATLQYRQSSDPLGEFIAARCVVGPDYRATRAQLYEAYTAWARDEGYNAHEILGLRTFGRMVGERYPTMKGTHGARHHRGIGLRANDGSDYVNDGWRNWAPGGVTTPDEHQNQKSSLTKKPPLENFLDTPVAPPTPPGQFSCDCAERHTDVVACDGAWYWQSADGGVHCPICHPKTT